MYLGGLSLALPHFFLLGWAHWCAIRVWARRKMTAYDPRAIAMLAAFSVCAFCHGFINCTILYPTYVWAFFNLLIACFLISELSPNHASVTAPGVRFPRRRHPQPQPIASRATASGSAMQAARIRRDQTLGKVRSVTTDSPSPQSQASARAA